ncbi:hypothetical protein ONS95_003651 [Cadophora gregata]|uniref:uncharacterized protein n=1 Tax=Cadophora gregata TaxID=51156 RepID=UPI0026DDC3FB|nr:uncharacterized protein ONS95_003651 [Cadophora gregata]KAK0106935.1 hypothetical protein ONS95_003651 [Cadophora gregata]
MSLRSRLPQSSIVSSKTTHHKYAHISAKMKLCRLILMVIIVLLGLGLGTFVGTSATDVTKTVNDINIVTVDAYAPESTSISYALNVDLRSQHFLAQSFWPTTTIRKTSTLHRTITVSSPASSPLQTLSTRTRTTYATVTQTITVPAASSVTSALSSHGVARLATSNLDVDNFDPYDYEFVDDNSKIELRSLDISSDSPSTAAACPTDISGDYQFPHLIVPTSIAMPDQPQGTQYTVWISPAASTLFNFDIPATYTGNCSLIFLFPYMSQLDPSAGKYTYSGQEQVVYQNGGLKFALLAGVANNCTTYNSTPPVAVDYGKVKILPGNKYTVAVFPCPTGKTITIEGSSASKTELDYFQNTGTEPIGLYLVPCV